MVVTLDEMKKYLRVDFEDDDVLLRNIMESAQTLCMDVARIIDEDAFEEEPCARIAVMYAVAYLYEHKEEADHLVKYAVCFTISPILRTASMLMPALVDATLTDEHTRSVSHSASGIDSISAAAPFVAPFCTRAE